jgi:hypothetical protein
MRTLRERSANKRERSDHADDASNERSAKFGQQTQTQTQTQRKEDPPKAPQVAVKPPPASAPALDLHAALSAVHAKHESGREMPWSMGLEPLFQRLLTVAERSGLRGAEAVTEIARRYDHMRQRAGMQYEPAKWKGTTLEELARVECWGGNAKPPERPAAKAQAPTMGSHDWKSLQPVDPDLLRREDPF